MVPALRGCHVCLSFATDVSIGIVRFFWTSVMDLGAPELIYNLSWPKKVLSGQMVETLVHYMKHFLMGKKISTGQK